MSLAMKPATYGQGRPPAGQRHRGRDALEAVWRVVLFPFRLLAGIWDVGLRTGFGFFEALIKLFFGLFGLGLLAFIIYGVGRVLLHPLFR
jgi:hypothetical protein